MKDFVRWWFKGFISISAVVVVVGGAFYIESRWPGALERALSVVGCSILWLLGVLAAIFIPIAIGAGLEDGHR